MNLLKLFHPEKHISFDLGISLFLTSSLERPKQFVDSLFQSLSASRYRLNLLQENIPRLLEQYESKLNYAELSRLLYLTERILDQYPGVATQLGPLSGHLKERLKTLQSTCGGTAVLLLRNYIQFICHELEVEDWGEEHREMEGRLRQIELLERGMFSILLHQLSPELALVRGRISALIIRIYKRLIQYIRPQLLRCQAMDSRSFRRFYSLYEQFAGTYKRVSKFVLVERLEVAPQLQSQIEGRHREEGECSVVFDSNDSTVAAPGRHCSILTSQSSVVWQDL